MNKKAILITLFGTMFSMASYAQTVTRGDAGGVVIDCSEMPSKFYTTIKRSLTTSATNTTSGTGPGDLSSKESNEKVYVKFEVYKNSMSGLDWRAAFDACRTLGGNWRLPTQRELMLMAVFHEKMRSVGYGSGYVFEVWNCWSATGHPPTPTLAYSVYQINGTILSEAKTERRYARCVRDL